MKKRLVGLLLFFISLFSTGVYAQEEGFRSIYKYFGWMSRIDLTKVGVSGENEATFWAKLILWQTVNPAYTNL